MNSLGKSFVVFIAATSLVFVAFVFALVAGGPNWAAERAQLENDYVFDLSTGETPTWSSKDRVTGTAIKSSPYLAEVIVATRQKQAADRNTRLNGLREEIDKLKPLVEPTAAGITADKAGVERRQKAVDQQQLALAEALQDTTQKLVETTTELQTTRLTEQVRREEGLRLKNVLEMLRNDLFASTEQRKALAEELLRLQQTQSRLTNRNQQLKDQLSPAD